MLSSFRWLRRLVFSPSTLPLVDMPQLLDGDFDFSGLLPVARLLYAKRDLPSLSSPSCPRRAMLIFLRLAWLFTSLASTLVAFDTLAFLPPLMLSADSASAVASEPRPP